jgi:hypothetical protein
MASRIFCIVLFTFMSLTLRAGEKPSTHLTGNPQVDFFSGAHSLANEKLFSSDSLYPTPIWASDEQRKSPWIAGLLSLAVPGAGELYSKSYVKSAVFFVVEITSWVVAYTYNKKGDRQTDLFQGYANDHWSAAKYAEWLMNNYAYITEGQTLPADARARIFPPDGVYNPEHLKWNELNNLEGKIEGRFSHRLPPFGDQQYYELIGKYVQFSKGWDTEDPNEQDWQTPNQQFYDYAASRKQANDLYDVASIFIDVVVANHILSALDAAWSAARYNSALHAEVRMKMQPSPYGYVPMALAKVTYTF